MSTLRLAGAAAIALVVAFPAYAVDIVNEDETTVQVKVADPDGSETLVIPAGETFLNVCEQCSVKLGASSVEATGDQVAVVRGGKVTIRTN